MDGQPHKILRQVLEVGGCPPEEEHRVRSEVRRVFYQRLIPAMDRACSALSGDGRIHRIDLLEIDLGRVPLESLESAMTDRFDRVFARQLGAVIDRTEPAAANSDLELFTWFLLTGTLPWWADRRNRLVLDAALAASIQRAPRAVRDAIAGARDHAIVCRRLVRAFSDPRLAELVVVLSPSLADAGPGFGIECLAVLQIATAGRAAPNTLRDAWWEEALRRSIAHDRRLPAVFLRDVLVRLARRVGIPYVTLLNALVDAIDRPQPAIESSTLRVIQAVARQVLDEPGRPDESVPAVAEDVVAARTALEPPESDIEVESPAHGDERHGNERHGDERHGEPRQNRVAVPTAQRLDIEPDAFVRDRTPKPSPLDWHFSDTDEIYVENAGLVILWPFLETLFGSLGLIAERAFVDAAARERAIGLLQYLAAEEAGAPEFDVPLNKVLCGMRPEEAFDFGPPITGTEMDACNDLLAAAIHHAPVLRDMSIAGFRSSFLLRPGQLGVRDGNWLLRVQRETHDVVLDRFPWSARIVRLPWMETVMAVE